MRVAIWTGQYQYWGYVHPDNLWKEDAPQMGGSEITALSIGWALAQVGVEVVFGGQVDMGESFMYGQFRVCPIEEFLTVIRNSRFDALVSWDDPYVFRYNLEHIPVKAIAYELNHTTSGVLNYPIDFHLHPSQWHAQRYREEYDIPEEKQVVGLTNGTDPRAYVVDQPPERKPVVLWCSSPDRGLHHLLRFWPKVREQAPEAELHIYYDMTKWMTWILGALQQGQKFDTTDRALVIREQLARLNENFGVYYFGGVSHAQVIHAMLGASVLAYTCDPVAPTECFSMVMLETLCAGMNVVATDADAFPELWGSYPPVTLLPLPIDDDLWVSTILGALEASPAEGPREVPDKYTFKWLAEKWVEGIDRCLTNKTLPERI